MSKTKPIPFVFHIRDVVLLPGSVLVLIPTVIHKFTPHIIPGYWSIRLLSIAFFLGGLGLFIWTNYLFNSIAGGTLAPWSSKQKLVSHGPYIYNRNPMLTGVLFMLMGECLWFRSSPIMIWCGVFFLICSAFLIILEEPFLHKKFGEEYLTYKKKVPRWIPSFSK